MARSNLVRILLALACFAVAPAAWGVEITGLLIAPAERGEHVTVLLSGRAAARVYTASGAKPVVTAEMRASWRRPALPEGYRGLIRSVRFRSGVSAGRLVFTLGEQSSPRHVRVIKAIRGYRLEFDLVPVESHTAGLLPSKKPIIVIDAGHGGQDPGTAGWRGTQEKDVTLRYARALAQELFKTGRYRIVLTRNDDRYLFLRERVAKARAAGGDLFVSLHADSAPTRSAHGLSVYTISEKASDRESAALAAKENKADVIGGMDLSGASPDVADILIDLAQRETRAKSARFADLAVKDLGREVRLLSHTHRFAGFAVLKAPDIPSVLIEIGFLSSPAEERLIESDAYESKVVRALAKAIDSYFAKHEK